MTSTCAHRGGKVIFINRYYAPDQSATSQLLSQLAPALAGAGLTVHLVCSRQLYGDPKVRLPAREVLDGVVVHRLRTTRFGRDRLLGRALDYATFHMACLLQLLRLTRSGDTVVAKTDPPLIAIVAWLVSRLKGARLINWLQDVFPEVASAISMNPLPKVLDRALRALRNVTLRSAAANVVLGESMRDFVRTQHVKEERIHIVENWSQPMAATPQEIALWRARFDLDDQFVVQYSGNLGRAHDFQTLLDAAAELRSENIRFLMIGGGFGMQALKAAVASLGLGNFLFLPYQPAESLGQSLAAANLHWVSLLPALEGFILPSKIYGILASARPIAFIGNPLGEVARLLQRTNTGICVRVGDAASLVRHIRALRADPDCCRTMGVNAQRLYRNQFTFERALAQWSVLLQNQAEAGSSLLAVRP